MKFFFDTNILITTRNLDFPLASNHAFWNWLVELGTAGVVGIPETVFEEIGNGNDDLARWLQDNKKVFWVPTLESLGSLQTVLDTYEKPIAETTLERLKADPFIITHAFACGASATVVTYEQPRGFVTPHRKKIPNVCAELGVRCIRLPEFLWDMR